MVGVGGGEEEGVGGQSGRAAAPALLVGTEGRGRVVPGQVEGCVLTAGGRGSLNR